jgi:hypothetical protein
MSTFGEASSPVPDARRIGSRGSGQAGGFGGTLAALIPG